MGAETVERFIREGIGVASFALMAWVVIYFTRNFIPALKSAVETFQSLRHSFDQFTSRVKQEHQAAAEADKKKLEQHDEILKQAREITEVLRNINHRTSQCGKV